MPPLLTLLVSLLLLYAPHIESTGSGQGGMFVQRSDGLCAYASCQCAWRIYGMRLAESSFVGYVAVMPGSDKEVLFFKGGFCLTALIAKKGCCLQ